MQSGNIFYTEMISPMGPLTLAATGAGLCSIEFGSMNESRLKLDKWSSKWLTRLTVGNETILQRAVQQMDEYFTGKRQTFDLPLDMHGTPFQKRVWQALTEIPFGKTASYKEITYRIGAARAERAVGGANHRNPLLIVVPCHRVIGSNGNLAGYAGGLSVKKQLLDLEQSSLQPSEPLYSAGGI